MVLDDEARSVLVSPHVSSSQLEDARMGKCIRNFNDGVIFDVLLPPEMIAGSHMSFTRMETLQFLRHSLQGAAFLVPALMQTGPTTVLVTSKANSILCLFKM